jgi:hypothetical protein
LANISPRHQAFFAFILTFLYFDFGESKKGTLGEQPAETKTKHLLEGHNAYSTGGI